MNTIKWLEWKKKPLELNLKPFPPLSEHTYILIFFLLIGKIYFSAAAMSSVDSSLLSGASYLTHNVYSGIFRKFKTSKKENVIVFRISVLFLGICSTLLSLSTYTIYGLWVLAGDLGFVIVFPQFFASVYFPKVPFIYYVSTFRGEWGSI